MDITEESLYILLDKVKDLHILPVCNIALSKIVLTGFLVSQCFSSVELILIILWKQCKPKLNLAFLNPRLTFVQEAFLFSIYSEC